MRVLITTNTLAARAGAELYIRDIALALRRRGHEPIAYGTDLGSVAEELRAGGVPVLNDLSHLDTPPDVIHAHRHLDAMTVLLRFPRVPAILFCHGSTPWEMEPFDFPSICHCVAIDDACHPRLVTERLRNDAGLETTMDRLIEFYERARSDRDRLAALPEDVFTAAASACLRTLAVRLKSHDRHAESLRIQSSLAEGSRSAASSHVLEDKLRRLTSSFSWRVTTPLRFLRRSFIDPFKPRFDQPRFDPENRRHYQRWLKASRARPATAHALSSLTRSQGPLISIVMPVFNTPEPWLSRAIESVRRQTYTRWELCIADDASTDGHIAPLLARFAALDARIKIMSRERNGHISAASNSALELATGEFTALLDHDDELAPHALAGIAFAISSRPDLEFIYTDEDKIDAKGRRFSPYFKPDWNPDLLLGQNYTCHLSVFRTARLREIGGWRVGYEGSQDWDLTLRFTAGLDPGRIRHIAEILYHWRAIPGSTALSLAEKRDYPAEAAHRALTDRLKIDGIAAELVAVKGGHWRVKRPLPSPVPKVSIIIPTRNAVDLLRRCVDSLLDGTDYPDFEIIIVNHRSDDPATLAYFEEVSRRGVRILPCNLPGFNFSSINNSAVPHATGAILAFLNNDLELINGDWLREMVAQAVRPEIGAVGAMLYYPDNRVQHAGIVLGVGERNGKPGVAGHAFKGYPRGSTGQRNRLRLAQNYSAVTAACLVVRRNLFEQVGGFDEAHLAVAFNDVDFCLRLRAAGHRNLWTPFAEFYHYESATRGQENTPEKRLRFAREAGYMRQKWGPLLDADPAYNPHLTLTREDFSLAWPPRPEMTPQT